MRLHRLGHEISSWMALVAIVMAAIAPTISHALQGEGATGWIELCSALGSRWVQPGQLNAGTDSAPASALQAVEHCPYCSLQNMTLAAPPVAVGVALLSLAFEPPGVIAPGLRAPDAWRSALPRGPPIDS
jgi:hypothetical protein